MVRRQAYGGVAPLVQQRAWPVGRRPEMQRPQANSPTRSITVSPSGRDEPGLGMVVGVYPPPVGLLVGITRCDLLKHLAARVCFLFRRCGLTTRGHPLIGQACGVARFTHNEVVTEPNPSSRQGPKRPHAAIKDLTVLVRVPGRPEQVRAFTAADTTRLPTTPHRPTGPSKTSPTRKRWRPASGAPQHDRTEGAFRDLRGCLCSIMRRRRTGCRVVVGSSGSSDRGGCARRAVPGHR